MVTYGIRGMPWPVVVTGAKSTQTLLYLEKIPCFCGLWFNILFIMCI